jgi:hypothetical protein
MPMDEATNLVAYLGSNINYTPILEFLLLHASLCKLQHIQNQIGDDALL